MRVLVAVRAFAEREFLLEVAIRVACSALHRRMLPQQRILRLRVVERAVQVAAVNAFPSGGVVARLAALLLETAFVRIGVAVVALAERQALVAGRTLGVGSVALLALHRLMKSSQGITRLGVVEFPRRIFPIDEVVTLNAVLTEPAFVEILVASRARFGNPEKGFAQVLGLDVGALGRRNPLGEMAFVAGKSRMFALEEISGFFVVEFVRIPLDEREVGSVVIRVATDALLAGTGRDVIRGVQSALGRHASADIGVASKAAKLRLAATNLVAVRAVRCAVKNLMLPCQWPGRDLSVRVAGASPNHNEEADRQKQPRRTWPCAAP